MPANLDLSGFDFGAILNALKLIAPLAKQALPFLLALQQHAPAGTPERVWLDVVVAIVTALSLLA
jgi:hypothetical protein